MTEPVSDEQETPPESELAIVASIKRGLADMEAGRVTPHDVVMAEIDRIIDAADRAQKR